MEDRAKWTVAAATPAAFELEYLAEPVVSQRREQSGEYKHDEVEGLDPATGEIGRQRTRLFDVANRIARQAALKRDQPFDIQIDWRPHQSGKASKILAWSASDVNFPRFSIKSAKNRIKFSDGAQDKYRYVETAFEAGHWYRLIASIPSPDAKQYDLRIIDRGVNNASDVAIWYDTREKPFAAPRLIDTVKSGSTVCSAGYRGQGTNEYSFDIGNLRVIRRER